MKQSDQFVAVLCGTTVFLVYTLSAAFICEKISLPSLIEYPFLIGMVCAGAWCFKRLLNMADRAETYEGEAVNANRQAAHWRVMYEETCQELNAAEEELQELTQAHSELGVAYNELKDMLLENGIDPDCPTY